MSFSVYSTDTIEGKRAVRNHHIMSIADFTDDGENQKYEVHGRDYGLPETFSSTTRTGCLAVPLYSVGLLSRCTSITPAHYKRSTTCGLSPPYLAFLLRPGQVRLEKIINADGTHCQNHDLFRLLAILDRLPLHECSNSMVFYKDRGVSLSMVIQMNAVV